MPFLFVMWLAGQIGLLFWIRHTIIFKFLYGISLRMSEMIRTWMAEVTPLLEK